MQNHQLPNTHTTALFHVDTAWSSRSIVGSPERTQVTAILFLMELELALVGLNFYLLQTVLLQLTVERRFANAQHPRRRHFVSVCFAKRPQNRAPF